jgi:hypothetical protein
VYHSHQGQDQWVIQRVLPGKHDGRFIDSGAGPDGIRGSNSYVLESKLGWKGLLVEPKQVKANRSAITEQYCLTDSFGEVEFVLNEYPELSSIIENLSEPNFAAGDAHKQLPNVRVVTPEFVDRLQDNIRRARGHAAPQHLEHALLPRADADDPPDRALGAAPAARLLSTARPRKGDG